MNEQPDIFTTWFKIKGTVKIDSALFHRSGLSKLVILHPGAVNWFLRRNLTNPNKKSLTYLHEWSHLQTTPIFLFYLLLLFLFQFQSLNLIMGLTIVIVSQAFWEIISEFLVIYRLRSSYLTIYENKVLRPIIFFTIMIGLNWIYWWKS